MARTINEEAHTARRTAILDAAQMAILTQGYDQMAISDIIARLGISSGAFYHYFDSKTALLEAVVERIVDQVQATALPVIHDPSLNGLEKLVRFFDTLDAGKVQNRAFVLSYIRVLYAPENAIFRARISATRVQRLGPWLEILIQQGVDEGMLNTPYPDQAARIMLALFDDIGYATAELFTANERSPGDVDRAMRILSASGDAIERVIGAPTGTVRRPTREELEAWLSRDTS